MLKYVDDKGLSDLLRSIRSDPYSGVSIPLSELQAAPAEKLGIPGHSEKNLEPLTQSIRTFGLICPIVVFVKGKADPVIILDGWRRVEAYRRLYEQEHDSRYLQVRCVVLSEPGEEQWAALYRDLHHC